MTERPSSGISRRALFSVIGSGAIAASVAALWRRRTPAAEAAPPRYGVVIAYADHDGWMVTPAEKARLAAASAGASPARSAAGR